MSYKILQIISKASKIKGRGTTLISVFIASDSQVQPEIAKLQKEYIESGNIKSKQTRSAVQDGLTAIINKLKEYGSLENGIGFFYGNNELLVYEPDVPLNVKRYVCDSSFFLEPLYEQIKSNKKYGLLVLDGKEATFAMMNGSAVKMIKEFDSLVPSKTSKGGQSAARYERVIQAAIKAYFHRVADVINAEYQSNKFDLIVGGSGYTKNTFAEAGLLNYQIKVLGIFDTGYCNENGIYELIQNAEDLLKQEEIVSEKKALESFKKALERKYASYGKEALNKITQAKTLLISKSKIDLIENININKELDVVLISEEHAEGKEFLLGFDGIAIILG